MKDDERLVIPFNIPKTKETVTISASAKKKKKKSEIINYSPLGIRR